MPDHSVRFCVLPEHVLRGHERGHLAGWLSDFVEASNLADDSSARCRLASRCGEPSTSSHPVTGRSATPARLAAPTPPARMAS